MIAIKGMEIPNCCGDCNLTACKGEDAPWNYVCAVNLKSIDFTETERPEHCPLVEIVNCNDCKHREKVHQDWMPNKKAEVYFCTLQSDEYCYEVDDDYFCAGGERRE